VNIGLPSTGVPQTPVGVGEPERAGAANTIAVRHKKCEHRSNGNRGDCAPVGAREERAGAPNTIRPRYPILLQIIKIVVEAQPEHRGHVHRIPEG
jgi:hypothetical protein